MFDHVPLLLRRVAEQRGEELGDAVGYRLGNGDVNDPKGTQITFCTIGYLLQYLSHNSNNTSQYTHIVMDEVHERSMDADMLSLVVKKLIGDGRWPSGRLVVMSATLQSDLFNTYFTPPSEAVRPSIFVGVKRFEVRSIFLDELVEKAPELAMPCAKLASKLMSKFVKDAPKAEVCQYGISLIVSATVALARPGSCVLIFLPGIAEIEEVQSALEESTKKCKLQILVLHSLVPKEDQDLALKPAIPEHCKVAALSTAVLHGTQPWLTE